MHDQLACAATSRPGPHSINLILARHGDCCGRDILKRLTEIQGNITGWQAHEYFEPYLVGRNADGERELFTWHCRRRFCPNRTTRIRVGLTVYFSDDSDLAWQGTALRLNANKFQVPL